MEHVFPSLMYELEDNFEFYIRSWSWTDYLSLNVASWFRLLCVHWYVVLLHCFVFWFCIIYDISISLCICVLDVPIILQQILAQFEQNQRHGVPFWVFWKSKKDNPKFLKITFTNFRHKFGLCRGKYDKGYIKDIYWSRKRRRMRKRKRKSRRGGGQGGEGVVRICCLLKGHGSTEVTWAMTADIGPTTAENFWQL